MHIYTLEKEVGDILLQVKNLCCGYDGNEVIHNLSFNINRGENISIIRPNGCGKSTELKALPNLIEYKGEIKQDGVEIRNIKRKDLKKYHLYEHICLVKLFQKQYKKNTLQNFDSLMQHF